MLLLKVYNIFFTYATFYKNYFFFENHKRIIALKHFSIGFIFNKKYLLRRFWFFPLSAQEV